MIRSFILCLALLAYAMLAGACDPRMAHSICKEHYGGLFDGHQRLVCEVGAVDVAPLVKNRLGYTPDAKTAFPECRAECRAVLIQEAPHHALMFQYAMENPQQREPLFDICASSCSVSLEFERQRGNDPK